MMRYLILLYLGVITMLTVDPSPIYLAPLVIVALSFAFGNRWVGIVGVLLFGTFTLNALRDASLSNLMDLILYSVGLLIPMVLMLELVLSSRPYRIERISPLPLVLTIALTCLFWGGLLAVVRVGRIGIFLGSNVSTQIFIIISLSLLLVGPFIISSGDRSIQGRKNGRDSGTQDNNR
ncbi:MAG: hypothetical protein KAH57_10990 [Thermoplasmata archaeon]|nr:hypothetical protein [Thermoplasmata archaeon]